MAGNVTLSDFLTTTNAANQVVVLQNQWVRLHNINTSTDYYSSAVTSSLGKFTYTVPPGDYQLYYGLTQTVGGTATLADDHYRVPYSADDDAVLNSATAASGSYTATAVAGGADFNAAVRIIGGKPWIDPTHPTYGASTGGTAAANTTAFAAAMADLAAIGGGVYVIPPGTYAGEVAVIQNNKIVILAFGVTLQPALGTTGYSVTQANSNAAGCVLLGMDIDCQSQAGTNGILIQDTNRATVEHVRVLSPATGITLSSFAANRYAENTLLRNVLVLNPSTVGITFSVTSGTGSFGETEFDQVEVSGTNGVTSTGISVQTNANIYRSRWRNTIVWCGNGGTGCTLDGVLSGATIEMAFEALQATPTVGMAVTANATGVTDCEFILHFTGTFTNNATDASNLGLVWRDGTKWYKPSQATPIMQVLLNGNIVGNVGGVAAVWDNLGGGHQWKQNNSATLMALSTNGLITTFGKIATAGTGLPPIYATQRLINQNAALTNTINYTPPAAGGMYRLHIHYRPTATGASTSVGITVTYKDSTGAITLTTLPFVRRSTSTIVPPPFLNTGSDDFFVDFPFEIDNSATAITVSTTGTFTGTTYNFAATLEQMI